MIRRIPNSDKFVMRYLDYDEIVAPLSPAEEKELLRRKDTDKKAFDELVVRNLRLVCSAVFKYVSKLGNGFDFADLFQEATMGLIHAIKKYDPRKGNKLSTYATWWIRDYIQKALARRKLLRGSEDSRGPNSRGYIGRAYAELSVELQRKITVDDLEKRTGLPREALAKNMNFLTHALALDSEYGGTSEDHKASHIERFADTHISSIDERIEEEKKQDKVREKISMLSPEEAKFIKRRFGIGTNQPRTRPQLAEMYNMSKDQVAAYEQKIFKKLADLFREDESLGELWHEIRGREQRQRRRNNRDQSRVEESDDLLD